MGRHTVPLPQWDNGGSRRTGGEGTHLALRLAYWKGKTACNVKSTPMSVQITKNSTEFESGGFVFQFTERSLALLFF